MKDVIHEAPVNVWNVDAMFGRAEKFINYPAKLPTITLNTTENNITYTENPVTHKTTLFQSTLHRDPSRKGYTML